MGASSSASPQQRRAERRSIRATFAAVVAGPAVGLMLAWALAAVVTLARHGFSGGHREVVRLTLLAGGGMVVIGVAVTLMGWFAGRLSREVSGLAALAEEVAGAQVALAAPQALGGGQPAEAAGGPLSAAATAETARAAAAITRLQGTAAAAAASQASLRNGLSEVFVSLARRNQSLLQRQLRLIDALEQKASDPAALADLFALDHLTTRMRRHAESLTILSGAAPSRTWSEPVPIVDVIRGAMAEVEDYKRVTVLTAAEDTVVASAVADMIHLLAELIENATIFSPSAARVEIRAGRVANGFAVEVDDRGLGIEPAQLAEINQQLADPPDFDLANADQLGLFVGGKLAARHGVRVSLRPSPYGGTTVIVLMPNSIVRPAPEAAAARPASAQPGSAQAGAHRAAGGLGLRPAETLSLVGRGSPQPALSAASKPAGQPAAPPDAASRAAEPAVGTHRGLPRRTRQANLSAHLRDSPPAGTQRSAADPGSAADGARSPEEARDLASSLQSGWQRGRSPEPPEPPVPPDAQPAGTARVLPGAGADEPRPGRRDG